MFDVKTRSLEGTEVCELDGHFISNNLSNTEQTTSDSTGMTDSPLSRTQKGHGEK